MDGTKNYSSTVDLLAISFNFFVNARLFMVYHSIVSQERLKVNRDCSKLIMLFST